MPKKHLGVGDNLKWNKVELPEGFLQGNEQSGLLELEELEVDDPTSLVSSFVESRPQDEDEDKNILEEEEEEAAKGARKKHSRGFDEDEDAKPKKKKKKQKPSKQQKAKIEEKKEVAVAVEKKKEEEEEEGEGSNDFKEWEAFHLRHEVIEGIKGLGFKTPTPIQRLAIPAAVIAGKDVIGAAETGSGKTLAYAIPIVNRILGLKEEKLNQRLHQAEETTAKEEEEKTEEKQNAGSDDDGNGSEIDMDEPKKEVDDKTPHMMALILTPTRELALQVRDHINAFIGKTCDIHVVTIVGGMSSEKQERLLGKGPEIVVATTGRFWELLSQHGNSYLSDFSQLAFFVLDEADRMVEIGHFRELDGITNLVKAASSASSTNKQGREKLHTLIFSATLAVSSFGKPKSSKKTGKIKQTPLDRVLDKVEFQRSTEVIDLTSKTITVEQLQEYKLLCTDEEKDALLFHFLLARKPGRVLVFANSIAGVRRLTLLLRRLNICSCSVHGSLQQKQRIRSIEHFQSHDNCVLIASDVAARGLDIPSLQYVVHYNVPKTSDLYVHRSGRTARAGQNGMSFALVGPSEVSSFNDLCKKLGKDIPNLPAIKQNVWNVSDNKVPEMPILRRVISAAKALNKELQFAAIDALKKRWLKTVTSKLGVNIDEEMENEIQENSNKDENGEGEEDEGKDDEETRESKKRAMEDWTKEIGVLKARLAKLMIEMDDNQTNKAGSGYGKRAMPSGTGMSTEKLDKEIEKARERRHILEKMQEENPNVLVRNDGNGRAKERPKLNDKLARKKRNQGKKGKNAKRKNRH